MSACDVLAGSNSAEIKTSVPSTSRTHILLWAPVASLLTEVTPWGFEERPLSEWSVHRLMAGGGVDRVVEVEDLGVVRAERDRADRAGLDSDLVREGVDDLIDSGRCRRHRLCVQTRVGKDAIYGGDRQQRHVRHRPERFAIARFHQQHESGTSFQSGPSFGHGEGEG